MALPASIEDLLQGNVIESERIELKTTWDPAASLKTICAFANDIDNWGGGYVVLGVSQDEDGTAVPVGVPAAAVDKILKDILNKCKLIRPGYMPVCDVARHDGLTLIVLWCPGGNVRPYSAPASMSKNEKERVYFIRKMASTIRPNEQELRDLFNLANNVPFDDRPNYSAELEDLNLTLIKSFLRQIGSELFAQADSLSFVDLCSSMQIIDGPPEFLKPRNVGLMFFNENPCAFFPCAQIDIVEFPDGLGGDRIIENTFTGPLDQQLRDALRYLGNMVVKEMVVKVPDAAESLRCFNYPYAALEEALSNAVYHKGYDVREPIEVRVLPDRIEVLSYPGADRSISIEGLRRYRAITRRYRNRRVGDFLKELRLTEGRNTGFHKILHALRANGSPDPLFETDEDRLYFLTTLFVHELFLPQEESAIAGDRRALELSDRESSIADYLAEHPEATLAMASETLGIPKATLSRTISKLKEKGVVKRNGTNRKGSWIVVR